MDCDHRGMARVAIQAAYAQFDALEALRVLVVCTCALAMIAA
jgi:hypothetical protein